MICQSPGKLIPGCNGRLWSLLGAQGVLATCVGADVPQGPQGPDVGPPVLPATKTGLGSPGVLIIIIIFERDTWPSSGAGAQNRVSWAAHAAQARPPSGGSEQPRTSSCLSPLDRHHLTVAAGRPEPTHDMRPKSSSQQTMHTMRPLDPHKQHENIPNMRGGSNGGTDCPQAHQEPMVCIGHLCSS